jgi:hypothetical protein
MLRIGGKPLMTGGEMAEVHGNRTHSQASKALWDKGFSG